MNRAAALALCVGLLGCQGPLEDCGVNGALVGTWRYLANQAAPAAGELDGTLRISTHGCERITGELDVIETRPGGGAVRRAGPVTGTVIGGSSIRFEALLGGNTVQHLGTIDGDQMEGSWLTTSGTSEAATGQFTVHREGVL